MKLVIWCVFLVVAVLWTFASSILVEAIEWSSQRFSSGQPPNLESITSQIVIPPWLSPWLEPSSWAMIFQSIEFFLANVTAAVPALGSLLGWLVPLVWIGWGLGILALLALAIAGTFILKRFR